MTTSSDPRTPDNPPSARPDQRSGAAGVLTRLADVLGGLNAPVGQGGRLIAAALIAVMLVIVIGQIVLRYVFASPLSWIEEVSKVLMVWSAFLVAPWAYRHGQNVSIDLFADALGARVRAILHFTLTLAVLWVCVVFFQESLALFERGKETRSATVPVTNAVFYAITPVSFACLVLVAIELALRHAADALDPRHAAPPEF